ncbi:PspC domain-containing protein [Allonocardiopsis opalescens]|uniref:Phage shock protein C (PspC) family protein n=1 Tax=Allonocardiopsis opalescens TaxID=1144618 RepID=A0A2T0QAW1_9ACTN|nr:PspC domain-containing protein [Allonocardiopsis opalescens]PRY01009.1 phage shock protein C (PspC) family protein [Allonocardiopsis opalescens]
MNGNRSLRRSERQRVIAGVCGGLGEYTGVDANLIRVILAVLTVVGFSGVLIYAVAWLVIPSERTDVSVLQSLISNVQNK